MAPDENTCPQGRRFAAEVQACVPEHPKPFEQFTIDSRVVVWVPALEEWLDKGKPLAPPGHEHGSGSVTYLRPPQPGVAVLAVRDVM
jgi:hypothetical protein